MKHVNAKRGILVDTFILLTQKFTHWVTRCGGACLWSYSAHWWTDEEAWTVNKKKSRQGDKQVVALSKSVEYWKEGGRVTKTDYSLHALRGRRARAGKKKREAKSKCEQKSLKFLFLKCNRAYEFFNHTVLHKLFTISDSLIKLHWKWSK